MRKSGGVAILMIKNKIEYLFGAEDIQIEPKVPFDEKICDFLDALSKALREDKDVKMYSDIIAFAFWIRRANLMKMKEAYRNELRLGKGLAFHIAPSNVPINFAYTFAFGFLSGNSNIIKASSKRFPQTKLICNVMQKVAEQQEYQWVKQQNAIVVYDREEVTYTEDFSKQCDVRVIWGGDHTIQEIRKISIQPRSTEMTFADRYSFAIISAKAILDRKELELEDLAEKFYNDTYLMDQNACSTPHLICWMGEEDEIEDASRRFWSQVYEKAKKAYLLEDIKVSDKYTIICEMAALGKLQRLETYGNYLYVSRISDLPDDVTKLRGKFGLFFEYRLKKLDDLSDIISKKVQTCAVYGIEKERIFQWMVEQHVCGIDRVVDVGKTLEIGLNWDGYDVVRELSRIIKK